MALMLMHLMSGSVITVDGLRVTQLVCGAIVKMTAVIAKLLNFNYEFRKSNK
jgi:hypothetical protein